jgi:4'-phosphopantetheinyl transferase
MALYLLENTSDYRLGIWKIEEDENQLQTLSALTELPKHANPVRRLEFLSVRALACSMGVDANTIAYHDSGKPYLKNHGQTISISHTKGYVAVLLSPHEGAGVDIEQRSERILRVRHKFMHPEEERCLTNNIEDKDLQTTALLLHWCAKEALFKSIPDEGVDFAQELRISDLTTLSGTGSFTGKALRSGLDFCIDYRIEPDFILTCSFSAESK